MKPHAACDAAGTGNGLTATPTRARKGKTPDMVKDPPTDYRASSRPYQHEDRVLVVASAYNEDAWIDEQLREVPRSSTFDAL